VCMCFRTLAPQTKFDCIVVSPTIHICHVNKMVKYVLQISCMMKPGMFLKLWCSRIFGILAGPLFGSLVRRQTYVRFVYSYKSYPRHKVYR